MRCALSSVAMRRALSAACALSALLIAGHALAQEIQLTGPLADPPERRTRVEWAQWLAGGAGLRHRDGQTAAEGVFGVGVEATAVARRLGRRSRHDADRIDFRAGGWASAVTDGLGMRGEGGAVFLFCVASFEPCIAPAVRVGAGWGSDGLGRAAHLAGTFTLGPRITELSRRDYRRRVAFASGLRFFTTTRSALTGGPAYQVTFGVEIDPVFFVPGFGLWRLLGRVYD
jgi:hypothetical protein